MPNAAIKGCPNKMNQNQMEMSFKLAKFSAEKVGQGLSMEQFCQECTSLTLENQKMLEIGYDAPIRLLSLSFLKPDDVFNDFLEFPNSAQLV